MYIKLLLFLFFLSLSFPYYLGEYFLRVCFSHLYAFIYFLVVLLLIVFSSSLLYAVVSLLLVGVSVLITTLFPPPALAQFPLPPR